MAVVAFTLVVMFVTAMDLLSTDSPEVSASTKFSLQYPKFDLYKEKVFLTLGFVTKYGPLPVNEALKYITVVGRVEDTTYNPEQPEAEEWSEFDGHYDRVTDIKYVPCKDLKDKSILEDYKENKRTIDIIEAVGFCPELDGIQDKYFVRSKFQDPPMIEFNLYILPCSLPNSADCKKIDPSTWTQIYFTQLVKAFDASNCDNPVTVYPSFDGILNIDTPKTKIMYYQLRNNEVYDDKLDFFNPKLKIKYADYTLNYKDSVDRHPAKDRCKPINPKTNIDKTCAPYITFNFKSSGVTKVYTRTYSKFFSSLGEVGGTAEILILFATLVYAYYNSWHLSRFMRNTIFCKEIQSDYKKILLENQKEKAKKNTNTGKNSKEEEGSTEDQNDRNEARIVEETHRKSKIIPFESKKPTSKPKSAETLEGLMDAIIEEKEDGIKLLKNLNELKIIQEIFFKPHQKILLPVVLLNIIKKERKEKAMAEKSKEHLIAFGVKKAAKKISLSDAYGMLLEEKPGNHIEEVVKSFLIKNLPESIQEMQARKSKEDQVEIVDVLEEQQMVNIHPLAGSQKLVISPGGDGKPKRRIGQKKKFTGMNIIPKKTRGRKRSKFNTESMRRIGRRLKGPSKSVKPKKQESDPEL